MASRKVFKCNAERILKGGRKGVQKWDESARLAPKAGSYFLAIVFQDSVARVRKLCS